MMTKNTNLYTHQQSPKHCRMKSYFPWFLAVKTAGYGKPDKNCNDAEIWTTVSLQLFYIINLQSRHVSFLTTFISELASLLLRR